METEIISLSFHDENDLIESQIEHEYKQLVATATRKPTQKPNIPNGVWPTMITPFTSDKRIHWKMVDELIEWYIEAGVAGIFACCLSSEMFHLTEREKLLLTYRVVSKAASRVPVIAVGNFGDTLEHQAQSMQKIYDVGVECVVIVGSIVCHPTDDDLTFREHVKYLIDNTAGIPLGLYECPKPYPRYITQDTLSFLLSTNRFCFFKETEANMESKLHKLKQIQEHNMKTSIPFHLKFYPANVTHLLKTLQMGAHGFCGISANVYPHLFVWLCRNFSYHPQQARLLHSCLAVGEKTAACHWPMSAKMYLGGHVKRFNELNAVCRTTTGDWNEEEMMCLQNWHDFEELMTQLLQQPSKSTFLREFEISPPVTYDNIKPPC